MLGILQPPLFQYFVILLELKHNFTIFIILLLLLLYLIPLLDIFLKLNVLGIILALLVPIELLHDIIRFLIQVLIKILARRFQFRVQLVQIQVHWGSQKHPWAHHNRQIRGDVLLLGDEDMSVIRFLIQILIIILVKCLQLFSVQLVQALCRVIKLDNIFTRDCEVPIFHEGITLT
jgi:hypothetical protein